MSEEKINLARRAVACPGWRWMRGMTDDHNCLVIDSSAGDVVVHSHVHGLSLQAPGALPDLDDPATLGCLLALVREALGDPAAYIGHAGVRSTTPWWLMAPDPMTRAATEAEALVAALEAAGAR